MNCKIADLRNKQVVCVKNGCVLGYVYDVEFNTASGALSALVIPADRASWGFSGMRRI